MGSAATETTKYTENWDHGSDLRRYRLVAAATVIAEGPTEIRDQARRGRVGPISVASLRVSVAGHRVPLTRLSAQVMGTRRVFL